MMYIIYKTVKPWHLEKLQIIENINNLVLQVTATGLEPTTTYFVNEHSTIYPNLPNDSAVLWVLICTVHFTVCSYHVMSFTLKRVRDVIRTCSQMHRTDKCSQHSSIIWPVLLNGRVFVYELSGCGFESRWSHLNFRFRTCFEQEVPWHSDKL